jgi:hypothetical protein
VNDAPLEITDFGTAAAGTLYLTGLATVSEFEADLIGLDWQFAWSPTPWNELTKARQGAQITQQVPVFDANGALVDGSAGTQKVFHPGKYAVQVAGVWSLKDSPAAEARKMFEEKNFAQHLDGLTSWTVP